MFDLVGFAVSVSNHYENVVRLTDVVTDAHGKEGSLELLEALLERVGVSSGAGEDSNLRSTTQRILSPPPDHSGTPARDANISTLLILALER